MCLKENKKEESTLTYLLPLLMGMASLFGGSTPPQIVINIYSDKKVEVKND